MKQSKKDTFILTLGVISLILIFIADLKFSNTYIISVLYSLTLLVSLFLRKPLVILTTTAVVYILILLSAFLSPTSESSGLSINSIIAFLVITVTACILIYYIYQEKKHTDKLALLANYDALTKVHNRYYFHEMISQEINNHNRYGTQVSLLLIDIDHFKKVNDTHGHSYGDYVLKTLAEISQEVLRETDVVVRFGGEEFIVVLPSTNITGALNSAERIRAKVESYTFSFNDVEINCTVSIGVSSYDNDEWTDADFVKATDVALYEAKRNGRNQVCEFDEDKTNLRTAFQEANEETTLTN